MLKAMNMARSTYYYEINKTDPVAIRNEELLLVIKKIFVERAIFIAFNKCFNRYPFSLSSLMIAAFSP